MPITARHFLVVKGGNPPEHNEDAVAFDLARRRFAISDGATTTGFARLWSHLLVDHFVSHADAGPDAWSRWLPTAQQSWLDALRDVSIPWYGQDQFQRGAFATFLAIVLHDGEGKACDWHAEAIGDSCLFHTRGDRLLCSFPLDNSSQFDSLPRLVGSRSLVDEVARERSHSLRGSAQPLDRVWLVSDALAHWCLAQMESASPPWHELTSFLDPASPDERFAGWIEHVRATRGLRNDDVVLLAIEV
jgi:hypothetical protein